MVSAIYILIAALGAAFFLGFLKGMRPIAYAGMLAALACMSLV
jgi:hypothetical protein